ncbi:MAG: copper homeostasis protein CutC [Balneolaceae bacterium]|nr:copper homeostasis protein CutC [Balneolaceae bacterium]
MEICINSDDPENLRISVGAAYRGGADRIELCSAMHLEGLTPSLNRIVEARNTFPDRPGLLVMIRPRGGDFCYDNDEIDQMREQITMAADSGADGVVLAALTRDGSVDETSLRKLVTHARNQSLKTTFHRAFDATTNRSNALKCVIECGVDRILTAGVSWGKQGGAHDGIGTIKTAIAQAGSRIEIVLSGGITPGNCGRLLEQLDETPGTCSIHAYSGVRTDGHTSRGKVRRLVEIARGK